MLRLTSKRLQLTLQGLEFTIQPLLNYKLYIQLQINFKLTNNSQKLTKKINLHE
jgi:hypothetical protein